MKLWHGLYLMIWLAFLEFVLVYMDVPFLEPQVLVHVILGFVMIGLAFLNLNGLKASGSPKRLRRIAATTAVLAVVQAISGFALRGVSEESRLEATIRALHLVIALAIIAQASSVATAYDMWEEKEYEEVGRLEDHSASR